MRLLSYNIHKGIGGRDRKYRLERIIEVIRGEEPDIVCLQEVDQDVSRSQNHDQPRLLSDACGLAHHAYQLNVPIRLGGYGNLILSRWPMHEAHDVCLRFQKRKPRAAQYVIVDTTEGRLSLVNWHLGLTGRERHWQARQLLRHTLLQTNAHLPTVVAGDANDWRDHLPERVFTHHSFHMATTPAAKFRSFPAMWPVLSLDKIFVRGGVEVGKVRVVSTPMSRRASDHLPVVIDFKISSVTK
jgi:endonuclease/exonuclease/phosphatase family metal-dependent hydrolase